MFGAFCQVFQYFFKGIPNLDTYFSPSSTEISQFGAIRSINARTEILSSSSASIGAVMCRNTITQGGRHTNC